MRNWWLASCVAFACSVTENNGTNSRHDSDDELMDDSDAGTRPNDTDGVNDTSEGENDTVATSDSVFPPQTPADLGTLRFIPAGSFTMGCVDPRDVVGELTSCSRTDELPSRTVTLTKALWMMESEMTQRMWTEMGFPNPSNHVGTNKPVEMVSWWEALEVANEASRRDGLAECYALTGCIGKVGGGKSGIGWSCTGVTVATPSGHPKDCTGWRLPTEAEWEYAARANTSYPFSGGNDLEQVAWTFRNSGSRSRDVCTTAKPRNAWALCDMNGNVWEWTWDWYASSYDGATTTDPTGPAWGSYRVFRGGDWGFNSRVVRIADRSAITPGFHNSYVGIRLVRSAD